MNIREWKGCECSRKHRRVWRVNNGKQSQGMRKNEHVRERGHQKRSGAGK